jgi:hypothetical protein
MCAILLSTKIILQHSIIDKKAFEGTNGNTLIQ